MAITLIAVSIDGADIGRLALMAAGDAAARAADGGGCQAGADRAVSPTYGPL